MHRRLVGQPVLGPVRQHEYDTLPRRQAQGLERRGEPQHPVPGLRPGQGLPATALRFGCARPIPFRLIGVAGPGRLGQGRAVGELPGR